MYNFKRLLIISFLFFVITHLYSQKQTNTWLFGRWAGINFNSGSPVIFNTGNGTPNATEGCSSISDQNGNLLFYTDGITIWRKTYAVMAGGLYGGGSSTQAALITPYSGNADRYYVFTTDGITTGGAGTWKGLNYTVVDMTLNSGNGGIVTGFKNRAMIDSTAEKVTAIRHVNGIDFWVITRRHFTNDWYAFLVTCNGVDTLNPVISSLGSSEGGDGYLKTSLDGKLLINANTTSFNGSGYLEVFDFDNATGAVSNFQNISQGAYGFYGVSMSPNDSLIYASSGSNLYRYERYNPTISSTETVFPLAGISKVAALQLASDKNIYMATTPSVSVLQTPDDISNPGFSANYLTYLSGNSNDGLPNFFEQLYYGSLPRPAGIDQRICTGDQVSIGGSAVSGVNYSWSPAMGLSNSAIANPAASPTITTDYVLTVYNACDSIFDTITVSVNPSPPIQVSGSLNICPGENVTLTASGASTYTWSPAAGLSATTGNTVTANPSATTIYLVTGVDTNSCPGTAISSITVSPLPSITVTGNTAVCQGDSSSLTASGAVNYVWSPATGLSNTTGNVIIVSPVSPVTYSLIGTNSQGCQDTFYLPVTIAAPADASIASVGPFCENSSELPIQLTAVDTGGIWSGTGIVSTTDGKFSPSIAGPGIHQIIYDISGSCGDADTTQIIVYEKPFVDAGIDTTIIAGASVMLSASGGDDYFWYPSESLSCDTCANPIATPAQTTAYYVQVTDSNGCTDIDTIVINVEIICNDLYIPTAFSPNNDGENDVYYLKGNCIKEMQLSIYNRWGELVFESTDISTGWDGMLNEETVDSGIYVYQLTAMSINGEVITRNGNITLVR